MAPSTRRVSAEVFKQSPADAADAIVVKDYATELVKDADLAASRVCQFVISTGDVDRDGDTIDPNGWDLASFQKSGVVLWAHDASQPPIAEPLAVWVEDGKLKSRCRFPAKDVYPFADTIYQLILAGIIKSTSVGFRPLEYTLGDEGMQFQRQSLMEYSIVSVPANPQALIEAKGMGIDLGPYVSWVEKSFRTLEASGLLVPDSIEITTISGDDMARKDAEAPEAKAGRVLSAANEERLQKAMSCYAEGHAHLKAIMDEHHGVSPQDPDGDGDDDTDADGDSDHDSPSAPKAAAGISAKALQEAIAPPPADDVIDVGSIGAVIADLVDNAFQRARGRD